MLPPDSPIAAGVLTAVGLLLASAGAGCAEGAREPVAGYTEVPVSLRDDASLPPAERRARARQRAEFLKEMQARVKESWLKVHVVDRDAPLPPAVRKDRARRLAWFDRAFLGMFIHWNPSCFTEREISFARGRMKAKDYPAVGKKWNIKLDLALPALKIYETLPSFFNPAGFDAGEVVGMARGMGAQYVVIVTKHHDGFCMFKTSHTDYNIMSTPYGRDIVKLLADEVHRQGLKLGFYYSLGDWHHPAYAKIETFPAYLKFMYAQWDELLKNYGKVDVVWYDGGGGRMWPYRDMARFIRARQRDCLIRSAAWYQATMAVACDYGASEYGTPPLPHRKFSGDRPAEWCFTLTGQWGWTSKPRRWLSAQGLIHRQVVAAGRGCNALMNLSLPPTGAIDKEFRERFAALGEWNRKYREALYDTLPGPVDFNLYGSCTQKGSNLYLFLTSDPPGGVVPLYGLGSRIRRVVVMGTGEELRVRGVLEMRSVTVPDDQKDPLVTVLKVELAGKLDVAKTVYARPGAAHIHLVPWRAVFHGKDLRYRIPAKCFVGWKKAGETIEWPVYVERAGEYAVVPQYSCPKADAGSQLLVDCNGQELPFPVKGTGRALVRPTLGRLRFGKPGIYRLVLKARTLKGGQVICLRNIVLSYVEAGK